MVDYDVISKVSKLALRKDKYCTENFLVYTVLVIQYMHYRYMEMQLCLGKG